MDLKEYCRMTETEMSAWTREIADILNRFERLPDSEKQKFGLELERLRIMAENIGTKVQALKDECPSVCSPVGTPVYDKSEAHDCIMRMNVWDSSHIVPEDM